MIVKQFLILSCLIFCSLQVFSQNIDSTNKLDLNPKYLLLKNDILLGNKSSAPTEVYIEHKKLPFFCDLELKLEASSKMLVKFRLGEVQAVEELEGKH